MGPYHKDVINKSTVVGWFGGAAAEYGSLEFAHEGVGVGGSQFRAHSSAECLEVIFFVKFKCIEFKD